ncbi:hypothetical protein [Bacillus sp. M6-12]|uniref:hypothetical protein n=1 Tax=Bacillus sp. M6-12 TaxID=2054166 RepID=UPI00115A9740|nr:hypothetical protein [Bacillus sp. M6-12]
MKKQILDNAKYKRKGLTKEEIIEKGLNIYPKSGIQIDSLLDSLIKDNYIETVEKEEIEVRLSPKGINTLLDLYTDNLSDSFLAFQKEVNALTQRKNETDFDPVHVAGMYFYNRSIDKIEETYFTDKSVQDETQKYHEYMFEKYGLKPNTDDFLLHLTPKLFLPVEDMWEDVDLIIEGIELPQFPMFLDRPYPNQRYIVAGTKIGKEKITTGFYPIIAPKDKFPANKDIRYHWKLGNGKEMIHDIHIEFEIDRGNLFSTEQSLSRSNCLPSIRLATFVEDVPLIGKNRNIEYINKEERVLHIKEKVTLTSFPTRLHSCFFADKNFEKWREKRDR